MEAHHIVLDGYSLNVMARDFMQLYQGVVLPPPKLKYGDYVNWENQYLASSACKELEKFWLNKFSGELPVLDMPLDFQRPAVRNFSGDTAVLRLSRSITARLKEFAKQSDCSLYMILLAVDFVFLHKLTSNQEDIVVGTPVASRELSGLEDNVGMFTNTLVHRNYPRTQHSFADFLNEVKQSCIEGFAHQNYPFNMLVDKIGRKGDLSRNPLFDTIFDYEKTSNLGFEIGGLHFEPIQIDAKTSLSDLTVEVYEHEADIHIHFIYDSELFLRESVKRWSMFFNRIITQVIDNPSIRLGDIEILSHEERDELLETFNSQYKPYALDKGWVTMFEEQVNAHPQRIAVEYEHTKGEEVSRLTFEELNRKSNILAAYLIDAGIKPNDVVALVFDRSADMIVATVGVLKSGGAFLPIYPNTPSDRIRYMLRETGAKIVMHQRSLSDRVATDETWVDMDTAFGLGKSSDIRTVQNAPQDVAYIIYTSGSTGKPKGVMVQHANLVSIAQAWRNDYQLHTFEAINLLQMASFAFDVYVGDISKALLNGGKVVVCPEETRLEWDDLQQLIRKKSISIIESTPGLLIPFMDYVYENKIVLDSLKLLIIGSDVIHVNDFKRICERFGNSIRILNSYGVTEAAVDSSFLEGAHWHTTSDGYVPIGKPMSNTRFYILDQNRKLQAIDIKGELYIGGQGVSKGYSHNDTLTCERFFDDPFINGGRMYKTGDAAKWSSTGEVVFLGRNDNQAKIRGQRVEVGEIEETIREFSDVQDILVEVKENQHKDKYLVAYFTCQKQVNVEQLKSFLGNKLPAYMIPSFFMEIDKLPLSANGKIDRNALPIPLFNSDNDESTRPRNEKDQQLIELWQEVIYGIDAVHKHPISITKNFFDLGGDSLKAALLAARVRKQFEVDVPIIQFFINSSIASISDYITNTKQTQYPAIKPALHKPYYETSAAQNRMFVVNKLQKESIAYNESFVLVIEGTLDAQRLKGAIVQLTGKQEILRTSFKLVDEKPVQVIHDNVLSQFNSSKVHLTDDTESKDVERFLEAKINAFIRPFDLTEAPLFRTELIEVTGNWMIHDGQIQRMKSSTDTAEQKVFHLFLIDMHHSITDGYSFYVFTRNILKLYKGEKLPDLSIQYKDYAEWFNHWYYSSKTMKQHERYWLKQFKEPLAARLKLPFDYPEPKVRHTEGTDYRFFLDAALTDNIKTLAKENDATLFIVLLTGYYMLLHAYSTQEDIVIGFPVAGRPVAELEEIIGMFVNIVPLRSYPKDETSFATFLNEVKHNVLNAIENQDYPFESLVKKLNLHDHEGRNPLFDVAFVLQTTNDIHIQGEGFRAYQYPYASRRTAFDLTLETEDVNGEIQCRFEYRTQLFKSDTIRKLADDYIAILRAVTDEPTLLLLQAGMRCTRTKLAIAVTADDGDFEF